MKVRIVSVFPGSKAAVRIDRAMDGFAQLVMHEAESMDRHLLALRERLQVARKARDAGELFRNQFDLLPATTARFAQDHRQRRRLWRNVCAQAKDASVNSGSMT